MWRYDKPTDTLFWVHDELEPGFVHSLSLRVSDPPRRPPPDIDLSDYLEKPRQLICRLVKLAHHLRPPQLSVGSSGHLHEAWLLILHLIVLTVVASV